MNYESFKQMVVRNIKNYLPEKYEKWEIRESVVRKINENMDCINLIPKEDSLQIAAFPNIYLNFFYKKLKEGFSFEYIMQSIAVLIDGATPPVEIQNIKNMVPEIIPTVINREKNEGLLKNLPHREFLDLAVIYRIAVATEDAGVYGCNVTYDMMKEFEFGEEELYKFAMINMKRKFPIKIKNLGQQMKNMMGEKSSEADEFNEWSPLFIVTNDQNFFGAAGILYNEILEKIADVFDENLYVIPSSIHEILVMPENAADGAELKNIIEENNREVVDEKEWLSDNLYFYDRKLERLEISVQNSLQS